MDIIITIPGNSLTHRTSAIHPSTSYTIPEDNTLATRYFQFLSSHKEDVIAKGVIQNLTSLLYMKHKCNLRPLSITPRALVFPVQFQHREGLECFLNYLHAGHLKNDFQTILASNHVMSYASISASLLFDVDIIKEDQSRYMDTFLPYQGEVFSRIVQKLEKGCTGCTPFGGCTQEGGSCTFSHFESQWGIFMNFHENSSC